tara:strand:+ start:32323 stop:33465 length:1143 start_codon:yes stop_codon:yes gene_type:complete
MAIIDHTNNSTREIVRGAALGVFDLMNNVYSSGLVPTHSSSKSTGEYWKYDKRYFLSTQVAKRSPGTVNPTAKYEAGTQVYKIDQFGLRVPVTDEEITEAQDPLQPLADASKFLVHNFIVDYELDFNNKYLADDQWALQAVGQAGATTGNIDGNVTLPVADAAGGRFQQFNVATSDPLRIMLDSMRAIQLRTGIRPNKLVMPRLVMDTMRDNPNVIQWSDGVFNTLQGGDDQTKQIIALHLGLAVNDIHVVEMVFQDITSIAYANRDVQNKNFGQAGDPTFGDMKWVMETSCLFYYSSSFMGKFSKTAAVCHKWDGLMSTIQGKSGFAPRNTGVDTGNMMIRSYYEEENLTSYVDGLFAYDNDIVAPELGFLLKDCIPAA